MNYLIREFGAVGNEVSFDTNAIQQAIDKCAADGGGRVVVEPGVYLTKTLYLRSHVELHLSAGSKLQGSTNPDDYDDFTATGFMKPEAAPEGNTKCLICASNTKNIAITGTGEINGAGPAFYDTDIKDDQRFYGKPNIARPRMILFYKCRNIKFQDTSFTDSPLWTMWLVACKDININRVKVIGDQKMINNDGIDIDSCHNVTVSDSFFKTGDDCIIIRAIQQRGIHQVQERDVICERVTVTNCVLNSYCQGIRVGCPNDSIIRNCTFSNLVIDGDGNGIVFENPQRYFKASRSGRLDLDNIMFSNITITSGGHPIWINVEEGIKLRRLSGITFSDIRIKSAKPITLTGCEDTFIEDIRFSNVQVETKTNTPIIISHCRRVVMNNVELTTKTEANIR
jgi:polygalacturonase